MSAGFFIGEKRPAAVPERIISLVPSQTELLADLGLDRQVVGLTKFCIHPDNWFRTKKRIGGTKKLDITGIRSLQPDLVIANKEENIKEQVEALAQIAPVWVTDVEVLDDALQMIRDIGSLTATTKKANTIAATIHSGFDTLPRDFSSRPFRVAYLIWRKPWMVAASGTFIHDLLQRVGWQNVFEDQMRYPEISLSELNRRQPDYIFLSSEPFPFKEEHAREIKKAVPNSHILFVDGERLSWYGTRLLKTPAYLQRLLHIMIEISKNKG